MTPEKKICNSCRRELPAECFGRRKSRHGLRHVCRNCERTDARQRYAMGKCGKKKAGNIKPPDALKKRARNLLQSAVRRGKIIPKPCQTCGAVVTQGHHLSYSRPLDVIWFCRKHHMELHYKPDEALKIADRIRKMEME